jgi:hypothetical protein
VFDSQDRLEDLPVPIELLRHLNENLDVNVTRGEPARAQVACAPALQRYVLTASPVVVVAGHPTLRDGPIITSQVCFIDSDKRWVRTRSRFRLDEPSGYRQHDDPRSRL